MPACLVEMAFISNPEHH
nr:hypothetical protein [Desulforamulus ruminis]